MWACAGCRPPAASPHSESDTRSSSNDGRSEARSHSPRWRPARLSLGLPPGARAPGPRPLRRIRNPIRGVRAMTGALRLDRMRLGAATLGLLVAFGPALSYAEPAAGPRAALRVYEVKAGDTLTSL